MTDAPATEQPEEESIAPTITPLRVLVVDDNVASAKTTGWMLEMIGHTPTLAHDGIEALQTAQAILPDAVILDIGLPGMNGYDICRELRKTEAFKTTMLIAQTGWGQEKDRQLAREAGFNHHLIKPVKLEDLNELLATVKSRTEAG